MITPVNEKTIEFRGLDAERDNIIAKLTEENNGSVYIAIDAQKVYLLDASSMT